jgi:hypothetical protein
MGAGRRRGITVAFGIFLTLELLFLHRGVMHHSKRGNAPLVPNAATILRAVMFQTSESELFSDIGERVVKLLRNSNEKPPGKSCSAAQTLGWF